MLFAFTLAQFIMNWYPTISISFVGTRLDIYYLSLGSMFTSVENIIILILRAFCQLLADGLLVSIGWFFVTRIITLI